MKSAILLVHVVKAWLDNGITTNISHADSLMMYRDFYPSYFICFLVEKRWHELLAVCYSSCWEKVLNCGPSRHDLAYMGLDARKPVFGFLEQQSCRAACYSLIGKYHT